MISPTSWMLQMSNRFQETEARAFGRSAKEKRSLRFCPNHFPHLSHGEKDALLAHTRRAKNGGQRLGLKLIDVQRFRAIIRNLYLEAWNPKGRNTALRSTGRP
jgi:hypothetical protein